jgi:hypothetical protein
LATLKRPPRVSELSRRLRQPAGRVEVHRRGDIGAIGVDAEEVGEELWSERKD